MKKNWKRYGAFCLVGGMMLTQMAGCGNNTAGTETTQAQQVESQETQETQGETAASTTEGVTLTVQLGEGNEKTVEYLAEDLDATYDEASATKINLNGSEISVDGAGVRADGSQAVIEKAGTYVVSGQLTDGQILIEASKDSVVRLILDGMEMSNSTTAPIYASEDCKVIITLAAGTNNIVSDGEAYVYEAEGEDEPDAPIFIKGDLTINGTGSLEVYGNYQSGIRSKDDLIIASGNITVEAQDDGIKGKDSVVIRDGLLNIKSVKDSIKSNNDSDEDKGYIWIDGGVINIAAEDDAIQAETALIINGGEITITEAQEALAGKSVDILGGVIKANASDDAINSAGYAETEQEKMMDQEGVYTRIAGGELWLTARADGIDSNGDLYMEGGTLYLTGPTSGGDGILDYNGNATITGGTVIATGTSSMMQTFGDDSTQPFLVVYYTETQKSGTVVTLTDDSGNELASYTPEGDFQAAIISSPEIATGNTYHVTTGDNTVDMEVTGIQTISGTATGGMGGHGGGGRGGMGGGFGGGGRGERPEGEMPEGMTPPDGEMPEMPEGMTPPDGEMPEMPEGMTPPDGEMPQGERGERPEGMTPPDGEAPTGEMPSGDAAQGGGQMGWHRRGGETGENAQASETTEAATN